MERLEVLIVTSESESESLLASDSLSSEESVAAGVVLACLFELLDLKMFLEPDNGLVS